MAVADVVNQDQVVGWAASAGREMASRAGAVTVRRHWKTPT